MHSRSEVSTAAADPEFVVGGQAVVEGVMMRGPGAWAVAVRRPQGDIRVERHPFSPLTKRKGFLGWPVLRGAATLVEMLMLGYRALDYSATVYEEGLREMEAEEEADRGDEAAGSEPADAGGTSRWAMTLMLLAGLGLGIGLFVILPNAATHLLGRYALGGADGRALVEVEHPILFNLVAGAARVLIIVAYIAAISLIPDIRRLFRYHGAEHKVVMAYEHDLPLDLDHIRPVTTVHPRCGTTFIAIVLVVSILIFALLAAVVVALFPVFVDWSVWLRKAVLIALHIVFLPIVAGLAYELNRRAGKHPSHPLYRVLLMPGRAFQRITTSEPDDAMVEVALASFRAAMGEEMASQETDEAQADQATEDSE